MKASKYYYYYNYQSDKITFKIENNKMAPFYFKHDIAKFYTY